MAVNRFSQRKVYNTFNPLSIQELAILPGAKQAQHDQALASAQEQKLAIQAMKKDEPDAARIIQEMESNINSFSNNLMERGVQPDTVRNFMDLKGKRDALLGPQGDATKIQNNYASYQAWEKKLQDMEKLYSTSGGEKGISPTEAAQTRVLSNQRYQGWQKGGFSGYNPVGTVNTTAIAQEYAEKLDKNVYANEGYTYNKETGMWMKEGEETHTPPPGYVRNIQNAVLNDPRVKAKMQQDSMFLNELEGSLNYDKTSGSIVVDGQYFNPNKKSEAINQQIYNGINSAIAPAIGIAESGIQEKHSMSIPGINSGSGSNRSNKNGIGFTENRGATINPLDGFTVVGAKDEVNRLIEEGDAAGAERLESFLTNQTALYSDKVELENPGIGKLVGKMTNDLVGGKAQEVRDKHVKDNEGVANLRSITDEEMFQALGYSVEDRKAYREYKSGLDEFIGGGQYSENKRYNFSTASEKDRSNLSANAKSALDAQNFKIEGVEEGEDQVAAFNQIRTAKKVTVNHITSKGEYGKPTMSVTYIPFGDDTEPQTVEIGFNELRQGKISNSVEDFLDYMISPTDINSKELNQQLKNEIRFNSIPIGANTNLIEEEHTKNALSGISGAYSDINITRANDGSFTLNMSDTDGNPYPPITDFESKGEALQALFNQAMEFEAEESKKKVETEVIEDEIPESVTPQVIPGLVGDTQIEKELEKLHNDTLSYQKEVADRISPSATSTSGNTNKYLTSVINNKDVIAAFPALSLERLETMTKEAIDLLVENAEIMRRYGR